MKTNSNRSSTLTALYCIAGFLLLALLFARMVYPEYLWLTSLICVPLVAALGALVHFNRAALKSRAAAYGVNSLITTLLVISIVGVLNFLSARYPQKLDLTRNKLHTLSDQTVKLVKGLSKPVKATLFSKITQREQIRPLLENYKGFNPKFEVEYVDPDREPTRAKEAGVKKYGTLHLQYGPKESNVDDPTEEKLTNALIKLVKEKTSVLCAITGHGEAGFSSNEADGYSSMKKALLEEAYDLREVSLIQENKVPDYCDAIAIMGPTKALFAPELKILSDYLNAGGRAIIAVDVNVKGQEPSPELLELLKPWYVKADLAIVIDPLSRALGVDAAVPILASFSKDHPVTRDFRGNCYFPFLRPLEILPGVPPEIKVKWLGQTTPKSFTVADFKELASGEVTFHEGRDKPGPLNAVVAVEGKAKDSHATRGTRMVVFGSTHFADNNYSRFGGNSDFFLNSVAWVLEDESMISIRAKDDGPGQIDLTYRSGMAIFYAVVIVIPLLIALAGLFAWIIRRRL